MGQDKSRKQTPSIFCSNFGIKAFPPPVTGPIVWIIRIGMISVAPWDPGLQRYLEHCICGRLDISRNPAALLLQIDMLDAPLLQALPRYICYVHSNSAALWHFGFVLVKGSGVAVTGIRAQAVDE